MFRLAAHNMQRYLDCLLQIDWAADKVFSGVGCAQIRLAGQWRESSIQSFHNNKFNRLRANYVNETMFFEEKVNDGAQNVIELLGCLVKSVKEYVICNCSDDADHKQSNALKTFSRAPWERASLVPSSMQAVLFTAPKMCPLKQTGTNLRARGKERKLAWQGDGQEKQKAAQQQALMMMMVVMMMMMNVI